MHETLHEIEAVIGSRNATDQAIEFGEHPAVDLKKVAAVITVVEVSDISVQIPCGIANLAIRLDKTAYNLFGELDVILVIFGRNPETDNLRAVLLDNLLRCNNIAE